MNNATKMHIGQQHRVSAVSLPKITALFLVLEVILFMTAFRVLSNAVNWPAGLDEPASVVLPLIAKHHSAVIAGYYSYMLSSILLIPLSLLLHRILASGKGLLLTTATMFGVLSGVMKSLGILRWLFLMPFLADTYVNPGTSATTRETIGLIYDAFNLYAGKIGEHLGTQLLTGLWVGLIAIALLRSRLISRWIGWLGIIVAIGWLVSLVKDFGISVGPVVFISMTLLNIWYLTLAVGLFKLKSVN
ncbi:DUF4386 domain-containing protein [Nostoc sp. UHCC 0302]|uniref:DUF4386 domain-containing protein n=1 Tax=Nostoc sp. UHCC 0302 TaxID=3134896 RepID=UPI00311CBE29